MSAHVTLSPKRYIFVCLGCGLLAHAYRKHAMTCSVACRVKIHRNGAARELREQSDMFRVPTSMMVHGLAIEKLCPDALAAMKNGSLKLYDAMPQAVEAYEALLVQILEEAE